MDGKFLDQLIGGIDHLMERSKGAERIDICRRGGGSLLLLCELFGEKAEEVLEYERLREIVQTVDEVVATLPVQAQALVAERYGLNVETALSNVGMNRNGKLHLDDVLKMLKQPRRSRRLRPLLRPKGRGR
jgi:hypothetical protein